MKRSVSLLICLTLLALGVAIESPAENAKQVPGEKPCCGGEQKKPVGAALVSSTCLQYLLYDDEVMSLWSADFYEDDGCVNTPSEVFIWTEPGQTAPQACGEGTGCLPPGLTLEKKEWAVRCPVLQRPLPENGSYLDRPIPAVQLPGANIPGQKWDVRKGLLAHGEEDKYVKVKNARNRYFAVALSKGKAVYADTYPPLPFRPQPKKAERQVQIGFEIEMDRADIARLRPAIPKVWERHPGCATAFKVTVDGIDYYVTTTAANAIDISGWAKPAEKETKPAEKDTK